MNKKLVIDISEWNSNVDFNAWISKRDLWGVIIRAGGSSSATSRYYDSDFVSNYNRAKAAGLHIGAYYYSVATSTGAALSDANHFAQLISGCDFDLPVYMDVENAYQFQLSKRALTDVIKTFCNRMKTLGYYPGIYMSGSPWLYNVYSDELLDYADWIAWWRESWPSEAGDIGMWQQGTMRLSDGNIAYGDAGGYGYIDCDWCVIDYPARIKGTTNPKDKEEEKVNMGKVTPADLLKIAQNEVGYSRWNDPQQGTKYGRWYAQLTGSPYFGYNGVPYCAMFVSWVLNQAGVKCANFPNAVAFDFRDKGTIGNALVSKYALKPGDVISFDWDGDVGGDHVGFVKEVYNDSVRTIEGNTDNGIVAEKIRSYGVIICGIRPEYDTSIPAPTPETGNGNVKTAQRYLNTKGFSVGSYGIDGVYGNDTKKALIKFTQTQLNKLGAKLAVDGINGNNTKAAWKKYGPTYYGCPQTVLVIATQIALLANGYSVGSAGIDGIFGASTEKAVKEFQKAKGLEVDGVCGPATFAKLF